MHTISSPESVSMPLVIITCNCWPMFTLLLYTQSESFVNINYRYVTRICYVIIIIHVCYQLC